MINSYRKSNIFLSFLILIALFFVGCAESPEKTLERIAKETNKKCPQIVDQYTTMVGCEALPDRTLRFTYKASEDFNVVPGEAEIDQMKKVLIVKLKERRELEFYLVNNVRFEHLFLNLKGGTLMDIKIEALDYK